MEELGGRDYRRISPDSGSLFQTFLRYQFCVLTEKEGMTATSAYETIAVKQNKDASTIRRDLERWVIEREQQKKDVQARLAEDREKQARLLEEFIKHQEGTTRQPVKGRG